MIRRWIRNGTLASLGLLVPALSLAQGSSEAAGGNDRTLRELLDEVRLLRQILQATSVGSVRAQVLLVQRRSHDERAGEIERQIASAKSEQSEAQRQVVQIESRIADFEREAFAETDPQKKANREEELRQLTAARDQVKLKQEQNREREADLAASLSKEQSEIDRIERDLGRIESDLASLQKGEGATSRR
jgi:chromosome segregation ATPase